MDEAAEITAEPGVEFTDLAVSAFDGYMEGARAARRGDLDSGPGYTVTSLPASGGHVEETELDGTEGWLSTETER